MIKQSVSRLTTAIAALIIGFSASHVMAQSDSKVGEQPVVVVAVAPIYPTAALAMRAKGEVVIEATIDAKGKVLSTKIISGNEYLRDSSSKAAEKWRFVASKDGKQKRIARLTFVYQYADASAPIRPVPEITTTFMPPYRVELTMQPYAIP